MNPVSLILDGETGLLFEGRVPDTLVFVPACYVTQAGQSWVIDHTGFYVSGWSEKNMRFSEACDDCDRVFPDEEKPFTDQSSPRLQHLLERLEHAYEVAIA